MDDLWKQYEADFNNMTDKQVEADRARSQDTVDRLTDWLEAVASWEAAGKPRNRDGEAG